MSLSWVTCFGRHKKCFGLLLALLAFALRVYMLDAQSLWNDEGTSIALASLSLEAIVNGAARDIHPPLYYFLLHFWMLLAGQSEFSVRFLSVVAGVLTVAVTFRIARVLFGSGVAIIAAFIAALSPFQVYYSQEARMYIWVTLWSAVSVLTMVKTLHSQLTVGNCEKRDTQYDLLPWLLYLAATLATLYTQYVGAFVVVAENLAFAMWLFLAWRSTVGGRAALQENGNAAMQLGRSGVRRTVALWLAAQIVIAAVFLPWYLFAGSQLASWPSISEAFGLPTLLWRVLNVFSVGLTLEGTVATAVSIVLGILFLIGWFPSRAVDIRRLETAPTHGEVAPRRPDLNLQRQASLWGVATCSRQLHGIVALMLWTFVPIGAMYVVSLSRPAYNPKFLLLATPAFCILVARGLTQLSGANWQLTIRSVFIGIGLAAILVPNLLSLSNYYYDPRYARDDYRAILRFVDANTREGDGILINAPGQIDVVRYYRRGDQQLFLLPRMRPPDPAATYADVDEMLGKVHRLYAIYYATEQSDPQGIVETRLAERAFKAHDEWHGDVRLAIYGIASVPRGESQDVGAKIGDEITLISYQLDTRGARGGDVLTLMLNWRAEQTPAVRYKVFVHLLNSQGQVVAQRDGEPVGDTRLTTTWRAGESVADNYGIFIEPGTPPGDYQIEIGMYREDSGARLTLTTLGGRAIGDRLMLETVRVLE